jgi:hypothetical protein
MLSRGYIDWLEKLPCNRAARRSRRVGGEWLGPWLPESQRCEHWEPFEAAITERDCADGVLQRLRQVCGVSSPPAPLV